MLRSLDDLDAELIAGNVDPDTYRTLHDDYTARAAAVVRSLDDGVPNEAPGPKRLRAVTAAAASSCSACSSRSCSLARSGNGVRARHRPATTRSRRPVTLDPNSYEAHIGAARDRCSRAGAAARDRGVHGGRERRPDAARAARLSRVDQCARRRPGRRHGPRVPHSPSRATKDLDQAIALDPKYLDAYFFKGYMLYKFEHRARRSGRASATVPRARARRSSVAPTGARRARRGPRRPPDRNPRRPHGQAARTADRRRRRCIASRSRPIAVRS